MKSNKTMYEARVKDLMAIGIEKEMARTMAKVEIEYGLIKPVVNFN